MQSPNLLGLLGPAGSGKSTAAAYLVNYYGATRYSLAAPLKELAQNVMDFTHDQLYGTQGQKETVDARYGFSPRDFLQRLGDGVRRLWGKDFWVKILLETIHRDQPILAVVDDVRYINEAALIRQSSQFSSVWRLETPDRTTAADPSHASESEWEHAPFDYVLAPAQRGLPELQKVIHQACASFGIEERP